VSEQLKVIKNQVRALSAYTLRPDRARIKLNQNESPWDAPDEIKRETLRRVSLHAWSRYPDFVPRSFYESLAEFVGWNADGIIAGNGSNEMIQALLMVTVGPGKQVLISEPTFLLYRQITTVLGGETISVPLTENLTYDISALRCEIQRLDPAVIIICSPNNPTGCVIDQADLVSLLENTRSLVVVDEAYFEFSEQSVVPLLNRYSNLIVLHTFSKAMGMAGLRIGYLMGSPELVREIAKAILPGNLNVISRTAAEVAMELYEATLRPRIELIIRERERLYYSLEEISGLTPVPSRANFMSVRSTIDPRAVLEELLRRDILIRDVSNYPMLKDYFRVTVGSPEENYALVIALSDIFKSWEDVAQIA
jgi:histidinol-phosphate aminotransferase